MGGCIQIDTQVQKSGIIIAKPIDGCVGYSLIPHGIDAFTMSLLDKEVYACETTRARETA